MYTAERLSGPGPSRTLMLRQLVAATVEIVARFVMSANLSAAFFALRKNFVKEML